MPSEKALSPRVREIVLASQCNEMTEYLIYDRLSRLVKDEHNRDVLARIAKDEHAHYAFWAQQSGEEVAPSRTKVWWYVTIARLFGFTFAIKLMERGEEQAQDVYASIADKIPGAEQVAADEDRHETELIAMLDEELLQYVGSMVLGLNDALVELTGTLAGITFALQNTRLIAMTGLVTGIAASLSMAASEYLSSKSDGEEENAGKSALYTGLAYIFTVALLILPYLVLSSYVGALIWTLANAVIIILVFTYYISVAKDQPFCKRFLEMAGISLGVAAFSFLVGIAVREVLGVEI